MRRRGVKLSLLALTLSACAPEETQDPSLAAWATQMEAARKARESGDPATAQLHFEKAEDLADADGRLLLRVRSNEALAHQAAGRGDLSEAEDRFETILALQLDSLRATGVPADELLTTLGTLGDLSLRSNDLDRAQAYYDQILTLTNEGWVDLSPQRPHLSLVLAGQARVLLARGDSVAADSISRRATGIRQYAQAYGLFINQQYDEAVAQFRSTVSYQQQHLGADHSDARQTLRDLNHVLDLLGQSKVAEDISVD
ncbi:MAG: hypothetical protein VX948_00810 [Candidatus Latescibacterota bacterium]|nr:hypothetical protein [Candidatus Latescibacterota bacterium]